MENYSPKLHHFLLCTALLPVGAWLCTRGGWWLVCGLLVWIVAGCMVAYIQAAAVYEGRADVRRATGSMAEGVSKLTEPQMTALGMKYPELQLCITGIAPRVSLAGVPWEWFREFMELSNAVSTVTVRSYEGRGREQERANWHAVTAYLGSCGMFAQSPRGAENWTCTRWSSCRPTNRRRGPGRSSTNQTWKGLTHEVS
jgi:hypothetical protein